MLSANSLRQTVHTHHASVHQAVKLVAVLLRVVRITAGLAESNGSLPPGLCYLQADCQEPGSTLEPYARQLSIGNPFMPHHLSVNLCILAEILALR